MFKQSHKTNGCRNLQLTWQDSTASVYSPTPSFSSLPGKSTGLSLLTQTFCLNPPSIPRAQGMLQLLTCSGSRAAQSPQEPGGGRKEGWCCPKIGWDTGAPTRSRRQMSNLLNAISPPFYFTQIKDYTHLPQPLWLQSSSIEEHWAPGVTAAKEIQGHLKAIPRDTAGNSIKVELKRTGMRRENRVKISWFKVMQFEWILPRLL